MVQAVVARSEEPWETKREVGALREEVSPAHKTRSNRDDMNPNYSK